MLLFQFIDGLIMAALSVYTIVTMGYIFVMWCIRRNFLVAMRSPALACLGGAISNLRSLSGTVHYFITWDATSPTNSGIIDVVGLPAVFLSVGIHVMRAVRVILMYHPAKRKAWGGIPREKKISKNFAIAYALVEIGLWSAAAVFGIPRVAGIAASILVPALYLTGVAAPLWIGFQMVKVDDMCNLGREGLYLGAFMTGVSFIYTLVLMVPMSTVALKYVDGVVWATRNVAPIREILKNADSKRPGPGGFYLVYGIIPWGTGTHSARRVVASADSSRNPASHAVSSSSDVQANPLDSIMFFPPVRDAFREFCRKALCSESFDFLVDVNDFQKTVHAASDPRHKMTAAENDFDKFLAIVKEYIEVNSCSEVNIDDTARRRVFKYMKRESFISLSLDQRSEIFALAEKQISYMLADNLLVKFKASAAYKELHDDGDEKL